MHPIIATYFNNETDAVRSAEEHDRVVITNGQAFLVVEPRWVRREWTGEQRRAHE